MQLLFIVKQELSMPLVIFILQLSHKGSNRPQLNF